MTPTTPDRLRLAHAALVAVALAGALALAGACQGYAELPLPLREVAPLTVESVELAAGAPGRVQVALVLPEDALGPAVIVGHPAADANAGARVVAWAYGPCPGAPAPADALPRLCLALEVVATAPADAFFVTVVAETRGDGRRFTVLGEVPLDRANGGPTLPSDGTP